MAAAASSTPPPVGIPAPLSLFNAIVSQNSLEPLQAVEKRLVEGLTQEERISLTMQLNLPTILFCVGEVTELSRDKFKSMMDTLIFVFNLPQMRAIKPPQLAFEDAQITRHLEVLRVAWDAMLAMQVAPKTEAPKGLSSRPLHGYSRLRQADCSLPLFNGQRISRIEFALGCLTPEADKLCPPVLVMKDMNKGGITSGGAADGTVILELQSLTVEPQRGHYSQALIVSRDVIASLPAYLDPVLPQPIIGIVQSYLVPTTQEQKRLYVTAHTNTWSDKQPYLFPYPPAYISSTQSTPKGSSATAESAAAASAASPESTATKASSAGTTILSASGVTVAASSSSAGALALPETVDAATTFPWIQAEINRLQEDGQANPRFEGDWIVHDTLWVIACVVFDKQAVIMLSHPNMGRALSYQTKAKDEYGYELVNSLGVISGHINPGNSWDGHTPLVEQFGAFTAQNKAKGESATTQAQSTPAQGQTDDSKLYMSVATNPR